MLAVALCFSFSCFVSYQLVEACKGPINRVNNSTPLLAPAEEVVRPLQPSNKYFTSDKGEVIVTFLRISFCTLNEEL